MRLTAFSRQADPAAAPRSAVFQAPGGTLGRSADNHLALPDSEHGICRVQAALRISDDACYLVNLSSMGSVSINGRVLTRDQEVPLQPGDELSIGPYTLKAEDPAVPVAASVAGAAAAAAVHEHDPLLEPDPLLESPLLEGADLMPPSVAAAAPQAAAQAAPAIAPAEPAAAPAPPAAKPAAPAEPEPPVAAAEALPASAAVPDTPDTPIEAERAAPPADTVPPSAEAFHPFDPDSRDAPRPADPPLPGAQAGNAFDDLDPPLSAEPQTPQSDPADVFSDLFGPGTLPVGSVPDVSAHPFDMESAQTRNPEDPLRQLPRGDANVRGPARDPLDLLGSPDDDDAHSVFSDQTPSTLPAHDPLAPHRSNPVTDTLNPRGRDDGAHAARDHLREYGSHLRPARVQSQDPSGQGSDKPPRK